VISSGGSLYLPFDVAIDAAGQVVVSDSGRLIRINPDTGSQTVIADNTSGKLGVPFGIDIDRHGNVLVANAQAIVAVDPATSQIQPVSSGRNFLYPLGVAIGDKGELYVANMAFPAQIVRVNPQNGAQTVVAQGIYLNHPQSLAVKGDDIYVTDVTDPNGNFGTGRVIHVDARTGNQTVVAEAGNLVGPVGIAVD